MAEQPNEFVDRAIARHLESRPVTRGAYDRDPAVHMQVEAMRRTLRLAERAMADEGLSEDVRQRVINRAVFGDPDGHESPLAHERITTWPQGADRPVIPR